MATHDPTNGGARAVEPDPRDKGLGELVKDLASQTSTLVRQEIKLAQAEVTRRARSPARAPACWPAQPSSPCSASAR